MAGVAAVSRLHHHHTRIGAAVIGDTSFAFPLGETSSPVHQAVVV